MHARIGLCIILLQSSVVLPGCEPQALEISQSRVPEAAAKAEGSITSLSVEQTIGLVFLAFDEGWPASYYPKAHPAAKEVAWRVLSDPSLDAYHTSAWTIVGFVGDQRDVEVIANKLMRGEILGLRWTEAVVALGILACREVPWASTLINKTMTEAFWRKSELAIKGQAGLSREQTAVMDVLLHYAVSLDPRLNDMIEEYISSVPNAAQRKQLLANLTDDRLKAMASSRLGEDRPLTTQDIGLLEWSYREHKHLLSEPSVQ